MMKDESSNATKSTYSKEVRNAKFYKNYICYLRKFVDKGPNLHTEKEISYTERKPRFVGKFLSSNYWSEPKKIMQSTKFKIGANAKPNSQQRKPAASTFTSKGSDMQVPTSIRSAKFGPNRF